MSSPIPRSQEVPGEGQQPYIPWHSSVYLCSELQSGCSVPAWGAGLFAALRRLWVGQQSLRGVLSSAQLVGYHCGGDTLLET